MCAWALNMLRTTIWDLYDPIELQAELQRLDVTAADAEFIVETLSDSLPKIQRHCQTAIRLGGAGILLGLCLCCTVPVKSKVREVVIGSTLLLGLSLCMRLAFSPEGQSSVAAFVTTCSMVVAAGSFLLFLNGLGWLFDDKALVEGTVRLFVFAVAMGVIILVVLPSMSRADENYEFGIWLTAFDCVAAAIGLLWCLRLMRSARLAILKGPKREVDTSGDEAP